MTKDMIISVRSGLQTTRGRNVIEQLYESCADLDEAEPEIVDFPWVTLEPQVLRERLHIIPAEQFYYQVIDLAGRNFLRSSLCGTGERRQIIRIQEKPSYHPAWLLDTQKRSCHSGN